MVRTILLILLAGITVLLVWPVTVHLVYREGLQVRLRVLFVWIPLYPPKPKKSPPASPPPSPKTPSPAKKEGPSPVRLVLDHLELAKALLEQGERFLGRAARGITLHHLRLWLLVAGEDAAQVGIRFGRANALCYSLLAVLQRLFTVGDARLDIRPNFLPDGEEWVQGEGMASARPVVLLWAALCLAAGLLKVLWPVIRKGSGPSPSQPNPSNQTNEKAVQSSWQ